MYDASILLRLHLDNCDATLRSMGLNGLYPEIFQTSPVEDIVNFHCHLFSLQYSCAKSWMESGLQVDAVVGHSFGQLTALCVSGILTLGDTLKLVSGRASLVQHHWGPERGSMISIEADLNTVLNYVSSVNTSDAAQNVEIACYNGPTSHVLVGIRSAIDSLENELAKDSIRHKRLNVTHGFHSVFTEPCLFRLDSLAEGLIYNKPTVALQTCTKNRSCEEIGPRQITGHTRMPVYFGRAIERLAQSLGPSTGLEAGSNSSVTSMARRALSPSTASLHTFQPVQLSGADAIGTLADATVNLWKCGHKVQFWPYHRSQKQEYCAIKLPPYQFEKSRHWLSWVDTAQVPTPVQLSKPLVEKTHVLLSLTRFRDRDQRDAEFSVDPYSKDYEFYVQGHAVLGEPLCPAPLYVELVSRAALILMTESGFSDYLPCVEDLEINAPLGMNTDRAITIDLKRANGKTPAWTFEMASKSQGDAKGSISTHATGRVTLHLETPRLLTDFSRYERLMGFQKFDDLKNDPGSDIVQGSTVYNAFSRVVEYADHYKGVRSVYGRGQQVAGIVVLPDCGPSALKNSATKPLAIDNFVQVAGLHVNCLNQCKDTEVFVCTKLECIQPSLKFRDSDSWLVYSSFTSIEEREIVNDIYVFDKKSSCLVMMVLGAHFMKVLVNSLTKVLSKANTARSRIGNGTVDVPVNSKPTIPIHPHSNKAPVLLRDASKVDANVNPRSQDDGSLSIDTDIRTLLHRVTDVPMEDFQEESTLEELGIDSLMITEVMSEICKFFELEISAADFANLLDIKSLRNYLLARGCSGQGKGLTSDSLSESGEDSFSVKSAITAATSTEDVASLGNDVEYGLAKLIVGHLETTTSMTRETNLANEGLDSLLSIKLASDIKKKFGATIDMGLLDGESTFGDLSDMVSSQIQPSMNLVKVKIASTIPALTDLSATISLAPLDKRRASLNHAQQAFEDIRFDYDVFTKQTGFADFWKRVYPAQARLVLAYTVEAFAALGCRLASLNAGQRLPLVQFLPKYKLLMDQLHEILKDSSLVKSDGVTLIRSKTPVDHTPSGTILQQLLEEFPHHASEHKLLSITGSKLAECLAGATDPLQLLFRSRENKQLLEDVYTSGPMYEAITKMLASFLQRAYATNGEEGTFHILELGGGTGGTSKYIVDFLVRQGISFTYTLTDLSGSLVTAAKRKFAGRAFMDFMILDIEKTPPERFLNKFHTILSTNCIHATRNLQASMTNIRQMLQPDGFVSLVEFTRNLFWFDLVFGLLEGWWLYEDGRQHVLASENFWDRSIRAAGFKHVTWTDGSSEEAQTPRIITGFPAEPASELSKPKKPSRRPKIETLVYKQAGETTLYADDYVPCDIKPGEKRPIGISLFPNLHKVQADLF